jgi:hypothetical protein
MKAFMLPLRYHLLSHYFSRRIYFSWKFLSIVHINEENNVLTWLFTPPISKQERECSGKRLPERKQECRPDHHESKRRAKSQMHYEEGLGLETFPKVAHAISCQGITWMSDTARWRDHTSTVWDRRMDWGACASSNRSQWENRFLRFLRLICKNAFEDLLHVLTIHVG